MSTNLHLEGEALIRLARNSIERAFGASQVDVPETDWLRAPGASFITLTEHGQLRGCIGSIEAHRPLGEDIQVNARAAAFEDPRFPPLSRRELDEIEVEVSILTPMEALAHDGTEDHVRQQLQPGQDGLVLEYGHRRATFLPQVWEQLPAPADFLRQLKVKAGLDPDFWSPKIKLYRYTVHKWRETEHGGKAMDTETPHVCQ